MNKASVARAGTDGDFVLDKVAEMDATYIGGKEAVKRPAKEYVNGMAHTNGIESVWALLKRSINGTWRHVSIKHLQRYIDEATFRLN